MTIFPAHRWLLPLAVFGALVLAAAAQLMHGGVFYALWAQDIFIPLEGVAHLQHGQWPHRDFATPVGAAYYLLHYLPTLVAPLSAKTIVYANLIVALIAAVAVLAVGRGRLPDWASVLAAFYVGLVALSPRQIGEPFDAVTNNATYNRYGWALIGAVAIAAALPGATRRGRLVGNVLVLPALLALLFFIKVTYFAAALGIIAVATAVGGRAEWRSRAFGGAVLLIVLAAVQAGSGLIGRYLVDMKTAAEVMQDPARVRQAYALTVAAFYGLAVVAALALGGGRQRGRLLLLSLAIGLAGIAIGTQNHPEMENPLLPIAALAAVFGLRADEDTRRVTLVQGAGLALMFALPLAQDSLAVLYTARAPAERGDRVAWLEQTRLPDLRLAMRPNDRAPLGGPQLHNDLEYADVLGDGVSLLRPHLHGAGQPVVLPFAWNNPFPALLGTMPVRHELAWWDADRTFTQAIKPDGERLLAEVDYVLIPSRYYNFGTTEAMSAGYAKPLARSFAVAGRNRSWTLYRRRDCSARGWC